jgi:integrase/recombinase XerD
MLSVYTRHYLPCLEHNPYNRDCSCPKWISGTIPGRPRIRISAHTRSWEQAERRARYVEIEIEERPFRSVPQPPTIRLAISAFLADQRARHLQQVTIAKSEAWLERQLLPWCHEHQLENLEDLTSSQVLEFRNQWLLAPSTALRRHEGLQSFFLFCISHRWLLHNPLLQLKKPQAPKSKPTDYFDREEFNQILSAISNYRYRGTACHTRPQKLRALILLMRWSGLAIMDAVTLKRACLNENDAVFLRRAKTGNPVYVPLPPKVAQLLRELPSENPLYFFWSGNGDPRSAVHGYRRSLKKLFRIAGLKKPDGSPKRCHPHMFRDTFAVEALLAGVQIQDVSVLLGHTTVANTEKYYFPWVLARQEKLSTAVKGTWSPAVCNNKWRTALRKFFGLS